ncbi:MAG: 2OG-Fe(II) oxygenase [Methyloceanibacter sp.]|uniref:2OG-Fe(II) oxygenase n=1 Tax=Methyloceanibacter sp. TaxID=1965321 RepID=UPI003D6CC0FA
MAQTQFFVGDPVPWFTCRSTSNPQFHFDTVAGRYVVLTFFGSASHPASTEVLKHVTTTLRPLFDDGKLAFFGVSVDPDDEHEARAAEMLPGIRYFFDLDRKVSEAYGAVDAGQDGGDRLAFRPFTLVLDPFMRVIANLPLADSGQHNDALGKLLGALPPVDAHAATEICAPILILPRVFEPQFCKELIQLYDKQGGRESGFMREKDGKTVEVKDHGFKRRSDLNLDDAPEYEQLRAAIRARFVRRIVPEIKKAYQYDVTRIERYVVACYDGGTGGFFRAHRDNTTKGTAHRRFACTVNLNAEDYEGGDLRFPEFGSRTYRAPTGGAVVFSCSLLHEATPVTKGKRYAFLPFLYDDAAAKIREENRKFLSGETFEVGKGKSGAAA